MIRFSCPNCKSLLESKDDGIGEKLQCPKCGQKVLVPKPNLGNKTMLGDLESFMPDEVKDKIPVAKIAPPDAPAPKVRTYPKWARIALVAAFPVSLIVIGFILVVTLTSPPNLNDTVWEGNEILRGYGRIRIDLKRGGAVTFYDVRENMRGNWYMRGDELVMEFGLIRYVGKATSSSISGTASGAGFPEWSWSATRVH